MKETNRLWGLQVKFEYCKICLFSDILCVTCVVIIF